MHYINWNQGKILKDGDGMEKPKSPINADSEQELKYITAFANKHPEMSKEELLETLERKNYKKVL